MLVTVFSRVRGAHAGDLELRNYLCDEVSAIGASVILHNVRMFGGVPSDPTKRQNVIIPVPTGNEYIVTTED